MILREMPSVSDIRDADAVRRFTLLPGSLAWRSFLINAGVVVASCAALIVSPATVSDPIVPSELAEELGQAMTGVLLQLDQAVATHPGDGQLREARETARESLDRIRHIARGLRPDVLDDLGLGAALTALCLRAGRHGGYEVRRRLALDPSPLPRDVQVVVYRVAQEGLTNVARHARAANVLVELRRDDGDLVLA